MREICSVILDDAIDRTLDYLIPSHLISQIKPGMRVHVPVKGSVRKATVFTLKDKTEFPNLKPITELLSEKELLSADLMQLANWMSTYYCCPLSRILKIMLPSEIRQSKKEKKQLFVKSLYSANELKELCEELRQKNALHAQVLDVLLQYPKGILLTELLEKAQVTRSPITTLLKKNILTCQEITIDRSLIFEQEYFPTKNKTLNDEQQIAFDRVKNSLIENRFETHLLYGVTGSGKTEIYLQAIEEALKLNKGVIFLVPEIALTSQTVERIKGRFKEKIALLHHRLSSGERLDTWQNIALGKTPIVIGARSALFCPLNNPGLIIVDEEHDGSYKQEETPCYHARDVAVMRGKFCNATLLLGSATPSLESFYNAQIGKYTLSTLKERPLTAKLPTISIVDMRDEFAKAKGFTLFSEKLLSEIEKRYTKGEQTLLFLNRRGYHSAQQCVKCGKSVQCPHCDVALTFHKGTNLLACHLCDYQLNPPPRACPHCHQTDSFKFKGSGTELVERSLHALFPQIRTLRLDADTTRHKGSHEKLYRQFRSGKADILIGTQMIAKGLHFPSVTLVGVLNIDNALNIPDFRASEFAFQLLIQVSGRAGRGETPGDVIIQTHMPDHPIISFASQQNYEAFFEHEMESRKLFHYPPFCSLLKATFTGPDQQKTLTAAHEYRQHLMSQLPPTCEFLPTIPCGHAKIKDNYRFQFILKFPKTMNLQLNNAIISKIKLIVDKDPTSTFF